MSADRVDRIGGALLWAVVAACMAVIGFVLVHFAGWWPVVLLAAALAGAWLCTLIRSSDEHRSSVLEERAAARAVAFEPERRRRVLTGRPS